MDLCPTEHLKVRLKAEQGYRGVVAEEEGPKTQYHWPVKKPRLPRKQLSKAPPISRAHPQGLLKLRVLALPSAPRVTIRVLRSGAQPGALTVQSGIILSFLHFPLQESSRRQAQPDQMKTCTTEPPANASCAQQGRSKTHVPV